MSRKILKKFISPFLNKREKAFSFECSWDKQEYPVKPSLFGEGNTREWEWYFEGESKVTVQSIEDICEWLNKCDYILDSELFNQDDFWQHPVTLEHTKKGDCEDFSLWAWSKMALLEIETEFVVGYIDSDEEAHVHGHAWLLFEKDQQKYIFEATGHGRDEMILRFDEHRHEYLPEYSVDLDFKTYVFKHGIDDC